MHKAPPTRTSQERKELLALQVQQAEQSQLATLVKR
jgi:hypothetical protein